MKNLEGRLAYVTGGSSGIGLETARQLAAKGCRLALFARNPEKLEKARQSVLERRKTPNQNVDAFPMDVTDPQGVEQAMKKAVETSGPPDIVMANAGQGHGDYFRNTSYEIFDKVMRTNVYGVRNVVASALPYLMETQGHVVIVASLAGLAPMPGYTAYGTSKFAAAGFAQCLRPELKTLGIGLTLVCPPEAPTAMVEEENQTLPKEFRAVKLLAGIQSVEKVSRAIVRGIETNRFLVVPGFMAKASHAMVRFLPGFLCNRVTDLMVRRHSKT